jgi:hypothetical protein
MSRGGIPIGVASRPRTTRADHARSTQSRCHRRSGGYRPGVGGPIERARVGLPARGRGGILVQNARPRPLARCQSRFDRAMWKALLANDVSNRIDEDDEVHCTPTAKRGLRAPAATRRCLRRSSGRARDSGRTWPNRRNRSQLSPGGVAAANPPRAGLPSGGPDRPAGKRLWSKGSRC